MRSSILQLHRSSILQFHRTKRDPSGIVPDYGITDEDLTEIGMDTIISYDDETNLLTSSQTSLEEQNSKPSFWTALLRGISTLASGFITFVWVAFSFHVMLFLFMNIHGHYTPEEWSDTPSAYLVGCLAAAPVLCISMARIILTSWSCTVDCWKGMASHPASLWRTNSNLDSHGERIFTVFFSGIPLLACAIATLSSKQQFVELGLDMNANENQRDWYELTMLAWAASVFVFQLLYMGLCWWKEVSSCYGLLSRYRKTKNLLEAIRANVILTQRHKYSGTKMEKDATNQSVYVRYNFRARVTKLLPWCYNRLEIDQENNTEEPEIKAVVTAATKPKRVYTSNEMFGKRENSDLQSLWSGNIAIVLITLALIGLMVIVPEDTVQISIGVIIAALSARFFWMALLLIKMKGQSVGSAKVDDEEEGTQHSSVTSITDSLGTSRLVEEFRVTELKEWACYATAAIEIIILFVLPVTTLFVYENAPIGTVFLVLGIHWMTTHYFSTGPLFQELGCIDDLDLQAANLFGKRKKNDNKVLVKSLLQRIRYSRGLRIGPLFQLLVYASALVLFHFGSIEEISTHGKKARLGEIVKPTLANNFSWEAQSHNPHPICEVPKGFSYPGEESTTPLADYAFLTSLTYYNMEDTQPYLDQYFGEGLVIDDHEFVDSYRESAGLGDHPLIYRLFTFSKDPSFGVVGITGTALKWDFLVDAQIWMGAAFMQVIKNTNPIGFLWEPILDEIVYVIKSVESRQLKDISHYRLTSDFVEDLNNGYGDRVYRNIRTIGHSMGGGLAALTAAMTGATAISFSGPNTMYTRRSISPAVTQEKLNTRVLNTNPQTDIFGNIDKPGMLHQEIMCRAPDNSLLKCHNIFQTLCEIQYQCGSQGRPINCDCVNKFGYPKPIQHGDESWEEVCPSTL